MQKRCDTLCRAIRIDKLNDYRMKTRLVFIDWMKVIGIYLIIVGHFIIPRPPYIEYIYVFSVPLFFVISGFLFKHVESHKKFWTKQLKTLFIPMVLICAVLYAYDSSMNIVHHSFDFADFPKRVYNVLLGVHSDDRGNGLQVCWFIYTLICLKVIFQYISQRYLIAIFMSVAIVLMVVLHLVNPLFLCKNSIVISGLCLPFFWIGICMRKKYEAIAAFVGRKTNFVSLFCLSVAMVCVIGYFNGPAWLYQCQFGKDFTLYIMGGVNGTILVFLVSFLLQKYDSKILQVLSSGTIIILGFHQILFHVVYNVPHIKEYPSLYYIAGAFVLFAFYPIILFTSKYFPIFLGGRKV